MKVVVVVVAEVVEVEVPQCSLAVVGQQRQAVVGRSAVSVAEPGHRTRRAVWVSARRPSSSGTGS